MTNVIDIKTIIDISKPCSQVDFANLIGISESAVTKVLGKGHIQKGQSLGEWIKLYCENLREQAAGRAATGSIDLATERAGLAREQKLRIALQNEISRKKYGPIEALELSLSELMSKMAGQLDAIPAKLKIVSNKLTAEDLDAVSVVINNIRNEIADAAVDWFSEKLDDDESLD